LDETLYGPNVYAGIKEGGILIINTPKDPSEFKDSGVKVITIDATSIALNILKRDITNVPMAGVLAAITNIVDLESINRAIDRQLAPKIREKNKALLLEAYNRAKGGK